MNRPPAESVPLASAPLQAFVDAVFQKAGMPAEQAELLSTLLTRNDLRGVFSHGTQQTTAYVGHFREGRLTPTPEIRVVSESPTTLTVDGGGGLGYFPCYQAAELLAPKALQYGVAAAMTRNHGHFGAAGIYSRVLVAHDLFCWITSGHQLDLKPGQTHLHAAGGSPMSFAIPMGEEPPFVLDFGAVHDMYPGSQHVDKLIELAPGTVYRCIGMGNVCQAIGGFLAGVPVDPARAERQWEGANQGSFMVAVDLKLFGPLDQFKREMDEYTRRVRELEPLAGFNECLMAGHLEAGREARYREEGIPISPRHAAALRTLAETYGLESPI